MSLIDKGETYGVRRGSHLLLRGFAAVCVGRAPIRHRRCPRECPPYKSFMSDGVLRSGRYDVRKATMLDLDPERIMLILLAGLVSILSIGLVLILLIGLILSINVLMGSSSFLTKDLDLVSRNSSHPQRISGNGRTGPEALWTNSTAQAVCAENAGGGPDWHTYYRIRSKLGTLAPIVKPTG
jgi:hypothetical protein